MELTEKSLEDMIKIVAKAKESREMKTAILPTRILWPGIKAAFEKEYDVTSNPFTAEYEHVRIHEFFDTNEEAQEYTDILQGVMEKLATEYLVYVRLPCTVTRERVFDSYGDKWTVRSRFSVDTQRNTEGAGIIYARTDVSWKIHPVTTEEEKYPFESGDYSKVFGKNIASITMYEADGTTKE